MIPKIPQTDTDRASVQFTMIEVPCSELGTPPMKTARLRPELQAAVDASWKRNEAAYRHLGR